MRLTGCFQTNIRIVGVLKEKGEGMGNEFSDIKAEKFPNCGKDLDIQGTLKTAREKLQVTLENHH